MANLNENIKVLDIGTGSGCFWENQCVLFRKAEIHRRSHHQGQGRILHGEPAGLARQSTER